MPKSLFARLQDHDYYSNSLESTITDEDLEGILEDPKQEAIAQRLLSALNAVEVEITNLMNARDAEQDEEESEEDEEDDE
jgi:hypothetical protein